MKYKTYVITAASVAALAFVTAAPAFAQGSKKSASPSPSASASPTATKGDSPAKTTSARAIPFHGTASAIDQSAKTFTIAGKKTSRVFKATDQTTVTKDGNTATFADLTDNERVSGSYWKRDDGTLELKSLKIGGGSSKKSKSSAAADDATTTTTASPSPKKK